MPPRAVAAKVATKLSQPWKTRAERWQDLRARTLLAARPTDAPSGLAPPLFDAPSADELRLYADGLRQTLSRDMAHRFDLLGSGNVQVRHGVRCAGFGGAQYPAGSSVCVDRSGQWLMGRVTAANAATARQVWSLVDGGYTPIDWQLDFKSGFRWTELTWHRDIPYGHRPGVDIKVPWELARMQHLPRLAWGYVLARAKQPGWSAPKSYAREFRNQVLDFIATNPPRFGVNWQCAMDVAIRIANWLVAYDCFVSAGHTFDSEFVDVLSRSVWDHAAHVAEHLEWCPLVRGNHYLADVVGLLFAAAHLPACPQSDAWLVGTIQQLVIEMELQFTPDGANFEASTCYHRLSAEMVAWGTAVVLALPKERQELWRRGVATPSVGRLPIRLGANAWYEGVEGLGPFPAEHFARLASMADFTRAITKPDGHVPQIGDNDNGRFLKLDPPSQQNGYEDHLDHGLLSSTIGGIFERTETSRITRDKFAHRLTRRLVERGLGPWREETVPPPKSQRETLRRWTRSALAPVQEERRFVVAAPSESLLDELQLYAFEDFGLYIAKSSRMFLAIRCGGRNQIGGLGHAHADQLSLELQLDGVDIVRDPGTHVYTAWPAERNKYRGSTAHFVPAFRGFEASFSGRVDLGLFALVGQVTAECMGWSERGFVGRLERDGAWIERSISVEPQQIVIVDRCGGLKETPPSATTAADAWREMHFSPGYGLCDNSPMDTSRLQEVRTVDAGRIRLHALASRLARVNG
jgi:hypothetical protein